MSLNDIRNAADNLYVRAGFNARWWPKDRIAIVRIHPLDYQKIVPKDQGTKELLICGAWVRSDFSIEPNTMQAEIGTLPGDF